MDRIVTSEKLECKDALWKGEYDTTKMREKVANATIPANPQHPVQVPGVEQLEWRVFVSPCAALAGDFDIGNGESYPVAAEKGAHLLACLSGYRKTLSRPPIALGCWTAGTGVTAQGDDGQFTLEFAAGDAAGEFVNATAVRVDCSGAEAALEGAGWANGQAQFVWHQPTVCARNATGNGPSRGPRAHGGTGVGLALTLLFSALVGYFVLGSAFQFVVLRKRGWAVLPHLEFWNGLAAPVVDAAGSAWRRVRGQGGYAALV